MNTIDVISLPKEVSFHPEWLETPQTQDQDKVDQVARTRLVSWTDAQLSRLSLVLKIGKVTCVIGLGLALFWVSVPGIVLAGAVLTVCFIAADAVKREQIARCQKACLQLEEWFIAFKKACEDLKALFAPAVDFNTKTVILKDEEVQKLATILDDLPENDLEKLAQELKNHHDLIFGQYRTIGRGQWSSYWIDHHLKTDFGGTLKFFYIGVKQLQERVQRKIKDEQIREDTLIKKETILFWHCERLAEFLIGKKDEHPKAPHPASIQSTMCLLTQRFDAAPQGQKHFSTIIDRAENWQQNIALFRSSLS